MREDRHDVFADARERCRKLLRNHPDIESFKLRMERRHFELFYEWLQSTDPDMPPPPICKALGPLTGDSMMSDKLRRLDGLADQFGSLVMFLAMTLARAEEKGR